LQSASTRIYQRPLQRFLTPDFPCQEQRDDQPRHDLLGQARDAMITQRVKISFQPFKRQDWNERGIHVTRRQRAAAAHQQCRVAW